MFRAMRRRDRLLDPESTREVLERGEYGVLSTVGGDGQPYATPLSYCIFNGHLYFHAAKTGQKMDNLLQEERVCFCVVGATQPVYDGGFSTYFESAVVYGKAHPVEDEGEKKAALTALCEKYLPEHMEKAPGDIAKDLGHTAVVKITLEHVTGKSKRRVQQAEGGRE